MTIMTIVWDMNPEFLPACLKICRFTHDGTDCCLHQGFLLDGKSFSAFLNMKMPPKSGLILFFFMSWSEPFLGARLGHVFFYGWDYYSQHPGEILKIWEGGLASHGAAIGNIIAIGIWSKRVAKKNMLWTLDRVVITIALAGALIRLGNFMNSEIVGEPSDLPWAVLFVRNPQFGDVPRHPSQIYEAIAYLIIFVGLYWAYWKRNAGKYLGFLFGAFLTTIFGFRIFVEMVKKIRKHSRKECH